MMARDAKYSLFLDLNLPAGWGQMPIEQQETQGARPWALICQQQEMWKNLKEDWEEILISETKEENWTRETHALLHWKDL